MHGRASWVVPSPPLCHRPLHCTNPCPLYNNNVILVCTHRPMESRPGKQKISCRDKITRGGRKGVFCKMYIRGHSDLQLMKSCYNCCLFQFVVYILQVITYTYIHRHIYTQDDKGRYYYLYFIRSHCRYSRS